MYVIEYLTLERQHASDIMLLSLIMTSAEEQVLEANQDFYTALQDLKLEEMEALWLHDDWVRCVRPEWEMLEGWDAVREGWQKLFESIRYIRITMTVRSLQVEETVAWVCCTEKIHSASAGKFDSSHQDTTNIFKKENGNWYMVHHHSSLRYSSQTQGEHRELVQ